MRLHQIFFTLFVFILLLATNTFATTYYVATTGDNSNPGTKANPWRTVSYATSYISSGDMVIVKGGIYKENIVTDAVIPYFNFVHQDNRRLKNNESVRKVPIHPACLPYVDDLYLSTAKSPGRSWSETFKENMGLPTGDGAHSLRHSFTSRMNEAGIIERVQDAILGHASPSITSRYGKVTLTVMAKELQKLH